MLNAVVLSNVVVRLTCLFSSQNLHTNWSRGGLSVVVINACHMVAFLKVWDMIEVTCQIAGGRRDYSINGTR